MSKTSRSKQVRIGTNGFTIVLMCGVCLLLRPADISAATPQSNDVTNPLNTAQQAYMEWTEKQFGAYLDKSRYVKSRDNSQEDMEKKYTDTGIAARVKDTSEGLQGIINTAAPGATIVIPKGTYTEPVYIDKPLTLKGQSRETCVFQVTANKPAIFVNTQGKGRVILQDMTVTWQLATNDRANANPIAVFIKDSKGTVQNCTIKALGNAQQSPVGLRAAGFSRVTVDTCHFTGFEYVVQFMEGTTGTLQDSIIQDCGHQGVINYSGSTMTVQRNIITGSKYHAVRSTGGTLTVKDNLLIDNANRGIYLGNRSCKGEIINNAIIRNGTGIGGFAQADVNIINNVLSHNSYAGIGSRSSCRLSINNNIITNTPRGITVFLEESQTQHSLRIGGNTYCDTKSDMENCESEDNVMGIGSPFTDPENGDFSLTAESTASGKREHGLKDIEIIKSLWKKWKHPRQEEAVKKTETPATTASADNSVLHAKIRQVRLERKKSLERIAKEREIALKHGRGTLRDYRQAKVAALLAGIDLCDTKAERIEIRREKLKLMTDIEKTMEMEYQAGQRPEENLHQSRIARMEAEIDLLKEQLEE